MYPACDTSLVSPTALAKAPFIKVEATKFTEVGYVGREVDSIIRDLMDVAVKMTRELEMEKVRHRAEDAAEDRVLDALLPPPANAEGSEETETRQKFRKMLREGKLDDNCSIAPDERERNEAPEERSTAP